MAPHHLVRLALAAAALLAGPAARAESMRCQGGLIATGDSKLDLLGKCGRPALRDEQGEERSRLEVDTGSSTSTSRTVVGSLERWTYNFGPNQFIQVVTLEGGTVTGIERGGYGYDLGGAGPAPVLRRARCGHLGLHEGDTAFDLLARCGEPATRDLKVVVLAEAIPAEAGRLAERRTGTVEIWTYDFGPSVLVRRLTLADGKVRQVETGGYGYSR
jgi:hypothetical protein